MNYPFNRCACLYVSSSALIYGIVALSARNTLAAAIGGSGSSGAATSIIGGADFAEQAEKVVALLNTAYMDVQPYILECSEFSGVTLNNIEKLPVDERPEELAHPSLPHPFYRLFRAKYTGDGLDGVFIERENLRFGTTGLGLQPYMLYSAEHQADFNSNDIDEVLLRDFAYSDRDGILNTLQLGRYSFEQERATFSYLHLARWVGRWLLLATDVTSEPLKDGVVRLVSAQMRLTVECHGETGELRRVEFHHDGSRKTVWWFEGTIEGVRFPARHPRLLFTQSTTKERDGRVFHGNVRRFDSIRPAKPADAVTPDLFVWSNHRPFAALLARKQVVDKDGNIDEKRTKYRNNKPLPTNKNLGVAPVPIVPDTK